MFNGSTFKVKHRSAAVRRGSRTALCTMEPAL